MAMNRAYVRIFAAMLALLMDRLTIMCVATMRVHGGLRAAPIVLGASPTIDSDASTLEGDAVNCSMGFESSSSLLLLTSSGFGSWANYSFVPEPKLIRAFRELVLRLPDAAWDGDGAAIKQKAVGRGMTSLDVMGLREPDLYEGLNVVVIEDACFLKNSFWNEADKDFDIPGDVGINYLTTNMKTSVELVRQFFDEGLDSGWCANHSSKEPGSFVSLGFERHRIHHISLWDQLADTELKEAVFQVRVGAEAPAWVHDAKANRGGAAAVALAQLLRSADVLVVNGGSVDFIKYVLTKFAVDVMEPAVVSAREGSLVYFGESAGSMVASADIGLTIEGPPHIFEKLLHINTTGIGLSGRCAIRPHDYGRLWDLSSATYGVMKGIHVVRLADQEALRCIGTACHMVGTTGKEDLGPGDPNLARLVDALLTVDHRGAYAR
eukprot:CAMPEP_0117606558 /NCGR_PEP_ID=MMETSP0784-20121206/79773_1 /TAXON_ID=39447 /ORGANISM="" /LENGTH=435 /DNA_ID=CAMNT_0005409641 /DNA_START=21 /DNA_END=1329 /DNA_ORIENTATION=+